MERIETAAGKLDNENEKDEARRRVDCDEENGVSGVGMAHRSSVETAAHIDRLTRFNGTRGHGYAAEQANHIIDRMSGKGAAIVGDNNAKNGADRMVDGSLIQSKYYKTAADSVNAAFSNGTYKYVDASGNVMQLEVPSDQYDAAVRAMERRIEKGEVPGVTDKGMAKNIVRRGNIDYKTAVRIAKAGNIDSLMFDAANAAVVAGTAMGVSGAITFAHAVWSGRDASEAAEVAAYEGMKMGGAVFVGSVISSQITRTSINKALLSPSIKLVRLLPQSVRKSLVTSLKNGSMLYGGGATKDLAKLLRSNIISTGALMLVMSASDIMSFFRGRMSAAQLFKNVATLAAGMGGAAAAGAAAGAVLGPVGSVAGGIAGGAIAGKAAHGALGLIIEDDVKKMLDVINDRLVPLAQEYMLSPEELEIVIDDMRRELMGDTLLDMFASADRAAFADELITRVIERVTAMRAYIVLPSDEAFVAGMGHIIELAETDGALEKHFADMDVNPQKIASTLMHRDVSENAARKAWYVTRQMNTVMTMQETDMRAMKISDEKHGRAMTQNDDDLNKARSEFDALINDL